MNFSRPCTILNRRRRCDGMVDVADSKSADGDIVWVRVPPPAPPRQKKLAAFRFPGLRKSRESSTSTGSFFLFRNGALTGELRFGYGGRVGLVRAYPIAPPRQKKPAAFRFPGLRKSRESSTSTGSFFLFRNGALTGELRFGYGVRNVLGCPGTPKRKSCSVSGRIFVLYSTFLSFQSSLFTTGFSK